MSGVRVSHLGPSRSKRYKAYSDFFQAPMKDVGVMERAEEMDAQGWKNFKRTNGK